MDARLRIARDLSFARVQDDEKLSLVAAAQQLLDFHIANASPEAMEVLHNRGMDEFLALTEVGREILDEVIEAGETEEAQGITLS